MYKLYEYKLTKIIKMNSSVISMITELEKRSYAEAGLCREYYNGE